MLEVNDSEAGGCLLIVFLLPLMLVVVSCERQVKQNSPEYLQKSVEYGSDKLPLIRWRECYHKSPVIRWRDCYNGSR